MHNTSGRTRSTQTRTRSGRARMLFTFQVAIFIPSPRAGIDGGPGVSHRSAPEHEEAHLLRRRGGIVVEEAHRLQPTAVDAAIDQPARDDAGELRPPRR